MKSFQNRDVIHSSLIGWFCRSHIHLTFILLMLFELLLQITAPRIADESIFTLL